MRYESGASDRALVVPYRSELFVFWLAFELRNQRKSISRSSKNRSNDTKHHSSCFVRSKRVCARLQASGSQQDSWWIEEVKKRFKAALSTRDRLKTKTKQSNRLLQNRKQLKKWKIYWLSYKIQNRVEIDEFALVNKIITLRTTKLLRSIRTATGHCSWPAIRSSTRRAPNWCSRPAPPFNRNSWLKWPNRNGMHRGSWCAWSLATPVRCLLK